MSDAVKRYMYMGYYTEGFKPYVDNDLNALSVFTFDDMVFVYFETKQSDYNPDRIICDNKLLPNGKRWVRLMDVFHYSRPVSEEYWKRRAENKQCRIRVVYLKPENVSKYIFYHYKMQEEIPGRYDKFGSIYIYANMLVQYDETPFEADDTVIEPTIKPNNLPGYEGNIIADLAILWEDFDGWWRDCEKVISFVK